jgi:hypothetical protein
MHVLLAAKSGYGKSWNSQKWLEVNLPEVDYAVVCDYKDEYRGLVEADLASWYVAGPNEVGHSPAHWQAIIESGEKVIVARYRIDGEDWRQVVGNIAAACRRIYEDNPTAETLLAVDEAHIAAPQKGKVPEPTIKATTTGRGEGLSTLWVTQRLAKLEETIISQQDTTLLGGFKSDADLSKISTDYPAAVHDLRTSAARCPPLPEELQVDGENIPLRIWREDGAIIGNEWVRADDAGVIERIDTRRIDLQTTHYGGEKPQLKDPYE